MDKDFRELMKQPKELKTTAIADFATPMLYTATKPLNDPQFRYPGFNTCEVVDSGIRIQRDVPVKLRDGVTIYTDIYRPDGASSVPSIVAWSPYGKHPVGLPPPLQKAVEWGVPPGTTSKWCKHEGPDPAYWCKQGYAVVNPDARGAFSSEGIMRHPGNSQEGRDAADLIEWLGTRDWSNGRVGMAGNSGLAIVQWHAAAQQPPHLAAIAPWQGFTDLYRQSICTGGIPEIGMMFFWMFGQCAPAGLEDCHAMLRAYPLINDYWEDKMAPLEKIQVPAYIGANFKHFHALGSLDGFRRISSRKKWLRIDNVFEWPDLYKRENVADLKRFFDFYLRGVQNDWELTPPVRLGVLDPGGLDVENRPEREWPLARARHEKLYLDASTSALSASAVGKESAARYAAESGQLSFTLTFNQETEITGYLKLRLWVEADGADDMDLFVYVRKHDSHGNFLASEVLGEPHPGAQGWLRVSHRAQDPARSTPSEPYLTHRSEQRLKPKEIVPVDVPIWPTSMLWHAGQQLQVHIAGHSLRDPKWFEPFTYETCNQGTHIIYTGGKYDSHLLVPMVPV